VLLYRPVLYRSAMPRASTDSFFIRASLNTENDGTFYQTEIDLGAFVDALGQSVLRIHNIAVAFTDSGGTGLQLTGGTDSGAAQFQLTTQSQADTILPSDRSVVASGIVYAANGWDTAGNEFPMVSHDMDQLPQLWTNGYLVAVESLYLGGESNGSFTEDVYVNITMECTSEKMTKEAGLALALSQQ